MISVQAIVVPSCLANPRNHNLLKSLNQIFSQPLSVAEKARRIAVSEMEEVTTAFRDYMNGNKGPWLVPADRLGGRLDAKYLRPWKASELESVWSNVGASSDQLSDLVDPVSESVTLEPDKEYSFFRIT